MSHLPEGGKDRVTVTGLPATLARSQALQRSWPFVMDLLVACIGLACFYGILQIAALWMAHVGPEVNISLSPRALPRYAFYSVVRIAIAYGLSLVFAIAYGYVAAYSKRLEALMLAALDILQSIPVLSFLPGVMLAMISLFPSRQFGLELGTIVLIFTGQVWNMAFSFYSSVKSIPRELMEASNIYGFSRLQRLWQLELPYAAIGLIWNSIMSVAGAWFFLMVCEMFKLGDRDLRLPGLGSYLQTAASNDNLPAILWGLGTMVGIVVATDQLIWRPVIAWSDRFKFEQVEGKNRVRSPLLFALQNSTVLRNLRAKTIDPASERLFQTFARRHTANLSTQATATRKTPVLVQAIATATAIGLGGYLALHALSLLRTIPAHGYLLVLGGAGATLLRVALSLVLASVWTIPVGVAIGSHPKLARIAQPLAQIAASIPATAVFPVLLLLLIRVRGGMEVAGILLMLLGTQWYILFNVIAGATAIPNDFKEVATLFRFGSLQRWKSITLPAIFPFLITGLVTASGGAWNASIIAEYFQLKGRTLTSFGLGEQISAATDQGHSAVLLLATIVMALMVVTINRLLWRPLFRLAESRYKLTA